MKTDLRKNATAPLAFVFNLPSRGGGRAASRLARRWLPARKGAAAWGGGAWHSGCPYVWPRPRAERPAVLLLPGRGGHGAAGPRRPARSGDGGRAAAAGGRPGWRVAARRRRRGPG